MFFVYLLHVLTLGISVSNGSHLEEVLNRLGIQEYDVPALKLSSNSANALDLLGDFTDFSFLAYTGQENYTEGISEGSNSRDLIYHSNDTFIRLLDAANDTQIDKIIPFESDSFVLSGKGPLSGFRLENQLIYNLTSGALYPIFGSQLNDVNAILVDGKAIYFGGDFSYSDNSDASLTGHSVTLWNATENSTLLLPFVGFGANSHVNSIVKLDEDNILFVGKFNTLDNSTLLEGIETNTDNLSNSTNSSFSSTQSGQLVPLQHAAWNYPDGSFSLDTFVCPDSSKESWSLESSTGMLECTLPNEVTPQKIRIYNSPNTDSEVSLFRIITEPSKGIMNLSYVDPVDGKQQFCDAFCPLTKRSLLTSLMGNSTQHIMTNNNLTDISWSEDYQDFAFVDEIYIEGFQFSILNSYGDAAGLSSFQVFQNTVPVYANNTLNTPDCVASKSHSYVTLSNNAWRQGMTNNSYILTEFDPKSDPVPKVTFYPSLDQRGEYTINMFTPGCSADNSCSSRGIMNVTIWDEANQSILYSSLIYQNNEELKYDTVYSGYLDTSPIITLEYQASVLPNNPSTIIVADFVDIIMNSIDDTDSSSEGNSDIVLNGLFQFQKSNFTDGVLVAPVGNTTLNRYPVENLPKNSSLNGCAYNGTLWLGGSVSGVSQINLDSNTHVTSVARIGTGGIVEKIQPYSEGLVMLGDFNLSSKVSTLTYNGTFNSFGNLNRMVESFTNITLDSSELLVFDNQNIFNVSSQTYISNTSSFSLSLWAAGQNSEEDLIFSGAVSRSQYQNINGMVSILGSNSTLRSTSLNASSPYRGVYLNESLSVYAIEKNDSSESKLFFDDGRGGPWTWSGSIDSMIYLNDHNILAVGSSGISQSTILTMLNLTNFEVIANETLNSGGAINSMIFFPRNSSLLVGGEYTIPGFNCSDFCIYNYERKQWEMFGGLPVTGNVEEIQLYNNSQLMISGHLRVKDISYIGLSTISIANYTITSRFKAGDNYLHFFSTQDSLISWNTTNLFAFKEEEWQEILPPNSSFSPYIVDVQKISMKDTEENSNFNRTEALLVMGRFQNGSEESVQAFLYDFDTWQPYYFANIKSGTEAQVSFFANEDVSDVCVADVLLNNPDETTQGPSTSTSSTMSTSTSASSSSLPEKGRRKIDRGFVVLVGLALAMATVTVMSVVGILVVYAFKEGKHFEPQTSRADKAEMIDSVPPEKLLQFL